MKLSCSVATARPRSLCDHEEVGWVRVDGLEGTNVEPHPAVPSLPLGPAKGVVDQELDDVRQVTDGRAPQPRCRVGGVQGREDGHGCRLPHRAHLDPLIRPRSGGAGRGHRRRGRGMPGGSGSGLLIAVVPVGSRR